MCRSFLTPDKVGLNPDGSHKYYGRLTKTDVEPSLNPVNVRQNGVILWIANGGKYTDAVPSWKNPEGVETKCSMEFATMRSAGKP